MYKAQQIILIWSCFFVVCSAQVGIGGGGGVIYPGFTSSDLYNSQFTVGAGYDVFIRHRLINITKEHQLTAKYSISKYFSDIDLTGDRKTRFHFSYLSIEVLTPVKSMNSIIFVGGAGVHIISINAVKRYVEDSNESIIIPSFIIGSEYWFNKNYNIFANLNFQFGEFRDYNQNLPVHGCRFQVGATMFLTE
jgi:hypothetical protein